MDEIRAEVKQVETVAREVPLFAFASLSYALPGLLCILVLCIQLVFSSGGRCIASHRLGDADGKWTSADRHGCCSSFSRGHPNNYRTGAVCRAFDAGL